MKAVRRLQAAAAGIVSALSVADHPSTATIRPRVSTGGGDWGAWAAANFGLILWGMVAVGLVVRLVLAFAWVGQPYDQESFVQVREALSVAPFDVYDFVVEGHWNYPPGFLLWVAPAGWISDLTGLPFHGVIQLPAIASDIAIAWLAQWWLGTRGADPARRLLAAALVLLGPVFVATSGYHGQIDSVGILPAVLALIVWERAGDNRAIKAGLLLGAAIVIKTAPGLMLLALLPHARSWKEGIQLVVASAAIPVVMFAPYVITDAHHALNAVEYASVGTASGLGLISTVAPNAIVDAIRDLGTVWNLLWIGAIGLLLWRYRPPATRGVVIVWTALYVFGTGFYLNYLILGLPFLLLDGSLLVAATVQAITFVPIVIYYFGLFGTWIANRAFDIPMLSLWLFFIGLLAVRVAETLRLRPAR
jgi:hypothetical protein